MKKRILISGLICLLSFCSMHAQESHWQCDIHSFQYDMTVYACLSIDGFQLNPSADYELAAFCGNECRGIASVETISSTGETYYYLRIRSNTTVGETLTFKCFDSTRQCELILDSKMDFESQGIKGYPSELYMLMGAYTYKIEYVVDSEVIATDSVKCGELIEVLHEPTKKGHTFSGWDEIPETMPAEDVVVSGIFTVNKYLVTFIIGDEVISSDSLEYGTNLIVPKVPEKEGYTFKGWGEIAKTVPASDLTYEGSYTINSYLLTYMVDGEVVESNSVVYGTAITAIAEPTKEGHTFSGWSEIPKTMPANDVTVSGTFTVNKYTVTYVIDDEVLAMYTICYGESITKPDVPERDGYNFAWTDEIPETMPAKDIVISGAYTSISCITDIVDTNEVLRIFTISGQRINELKQGLNIVFMKDCKIRKVFVR